MKIRLGVTFLPLLTMLISSCPQPPARELTWGVLDLTTNISTNVGAHSSLHINAGDRYVVTFNVKDPDKIGHLAVWGDGSFTCNDSDNNQFPDQLPAGIPKKEVSPGNVQSFVTTDEFKYIELSCGRHSTPFREFTVTNGTLHIHGEETSVAGGTVTAALDLMR
jgi:hypothetical protein